MNISHPNILQLLAIEVKPQFNTFSMIAEMMSNGNITSYIRVNKANRLRLVRPLVLTVEQRSLIGVAAEGCRERPSTPPWYWNYSRGYKRRKSIVSVISPFASAVINITSPNLPRS